MDAMNADRLDVRVVQVAQAVLIRMQRIFVYLSSILNLSLVPLIRVSIFCINATMSTATQSTQYGTINDESLAEWYGNYHYNNDKRMNYVWVADFQSVREVEETVDGQIFARFG